MYFACVLHFAMSSSAFHLHVFQNLHPFGFPQFSPLSVLSPDTLARARRPAQTLFRERDKIFSEWAEICRVALVYNEKTAHQILFHLEVV